jgi:hypothetical protein
VGFGAVDGEFGEEGEGDGVVDGAEGGDFFGGAGFLLGEVVGGEAKDDEAAVFVLLVEGFEGGVLRGEAAFGGYVDDEEDFAGVVGEGGGGAGEGGERDGGESGHGGSLLRGLHIKTSTQIIAFWRSVAYSEATDLEIE